MMTTQETLTFRYKKHMLLIRESFPKFLPNIQFDSKRFTEMVFVDMKNSVAVLEAKALKGWVNQI